MTDESSSDVRKNKSCVVEKETFLFTIARERTDKFMADHFQTCIVCNNVMASSCKEMFDDRYGYPGLFEIYECSFCGQMKTLPSLRESEISKVYTDYYPRKKMDFEAVSAQTADLNSKWVRLKSWLNGVTNQGQYYAKAGMNVLDYGCGAGTSLLEAKQLGACSYGIEADANVRPVADHFKLDIHIGSLADNPFPGVQFDLIVLNQVIEHVIDPANLMVQLFGRLKNDGMIAVSFPNAKSIYKKMFGRSWINWHIPYHIHHFNKKSFGILCNRNGWRIIKWKTVTPNLWTVLQFRSIFARPSVGVPNEMWGAGNRGETEGNKNNGEMAAPSQPSRLIIRKLRQIIKRGVVVCAGILMTFINRFIDALTLGDSLIVIVKRAE